MKLWHRRMTFQLTPLLDLLLIVIFAQYMEVEQTSAREQTAAARDLAAALIETQRHEATLAVSQQRIDELSARIVELAERVRQAVDRQEQVGEIVAGLFRVPEGLVDEALGVAAAGTPPRTPEETERLRMQFRQFAASHGRDIVRHLLTYDELVKRCDIWEIYIADNGNIVFTAGKQRHEFRADSAAQFDDKLFEAYKTLPEPKSVVIILLSYGDAKAMYRKAAIDGLTTVAERMRADSNARSRFDYAILGYNPQGPVADNR